jgi:hypothetical protein
MLDKLALAYKNAAIEHEAAVRSKAEPALLDSWIHSSVAVAFVVVAVPAGVVGLIRLEPGICAAGLV